MMSIRQQFLDRAQKACQDSLHRLREAETAGAFSVNDGKYWATGTYGKREHVADLLVVASFVKAEMVTVLTLLESGLAIEAMEDRP